MCRRADSYLMDVLRRNLGVDHQAVLGWHDQHDRTTIAHTLADRVAAIPAFASSTSLFVPRGHLLTREKTLSLKRLVEFPFVSYPRGFAIRLTLDKVFDEAGLRPQIVCTATDADACKKYVEAGMGVAILAKVAFDPVADVNLFAMNVDSLFQPSTVQVVLRKQAYVSRSMYSFISTWAPHISQQMIRKVLEGGGTASDPRRTRTLPPIEQLARATIA